LAYLIYHAALKDGRVRFRRGKLTGCGDVTLVVEIEGVVILVRSCGDDEHDVKLDYDLICRYRCQVAIVAVSLPERDGGQKKSYQCYLKSKDAMAAVVKEYSTRYDLQSASFDALNRRCADELFAEVMRLVKQIG